MWLFFIVADPAHKIRYDLFSVQVLQNHVNWVELWNVSSSEKVGDVVMWMVEDILPNLPSASGTQLEVSPEGARSVRVCQYADVGNPFEYGRVRPESPGWHAVISGLIFCRSRRPSERLPSSTTEGLWLRIKAWDRKGMNTHNWIHLVTEGQ